MLKYLGRVITEDAESEIKERRTAIHKQEFIERGELMGSGLSKKTEENNDKRTDAKGALYGTKKGLKSTEAFEMWIWSRMEKSEEYVSNVDVLKRVVEKRTLFGKIRRWQHQWIGHNLREDSPC